MGLERERLAQGSLLFDQEQQIREILSQNIYGVDINPASVEIARLALWLHTARANRPLCDLNRNVRDGNSLIDPVVIGREVQQRPRKHPDIVSRYALIRLTEHRVRNVQRFQFDIVS